MDKKLTRKLPAELALPNGALPVEERLVVDDRAHLTPSEMVERKLVGLLKQNPLPVSQMNTGRRLIRSR
jgi:hypothetical protein